MPLPVVGPVTLDRREGPHGEVVLRQRGEHHEIIANGCFLMDTSDGRSERLLVDAALDALDGLDGLDARSAPALLIGGLGVGFSLARAAAEPPLGPHRRRRARTGDHRLAPHRPPRGHLRRRPRRSAQPDPSHGSRRVPAYHYGPLRRLCLDIDNGPDWTVTDDNENLYSPAGLAACQGRLEPGGVLAVWSASPPPLSRMRCGMPDSAG